MELERPYVISSNADNVKIEPMGNQTRISNSGNNVTIVSKGVGDSIASSGHNCYISSSGMCSRIVSTGDFDKIIADGEYSTAIVCGVRALIKASSTSIVFATEYEIDENTGVKISKCARMALVCNSQCLDYEGHTLKPSLFYTVWKGEFYAMKEFPVFGTLIQGVILSKERDGKLGITKMFEWHDLDEKPIKMCVAQEGTKYYAWGYTKKEAIDWLKKYKKKNFREDIVEKVKTTNKISTIEVSALFLIKPYILHELCKKNNIKDFNDVDMETAYNIVKSKCSDLEYWKQIRGDRR